MQAGTSRSGIIAAGSWTLDRVKLVDHWPEEEHLAEILDTDYQGGGSAHNLGIGIRKLDPTMEVEAIGLVGKDSEGEFIQSSARNHGINTNQLQQLDSVSTSYTDVISDVTSAKRTFFHFRGGNDHIDPTHFNFTQCHGKILHLGLLGLHKRMDTESYLNDHGDYENGWVNVLKAAQTAGIKTNIELVSIAPDKIRQIATPCLPHLDYFIANEFEAGALADIPTIESDGSVNETACLKAAQRIIELSTASLVVVHHPGAAIAVTSDGQQCQRNSFHIDPSLFGSAVGAGDAFAAGVLYSLHQGWALDDTLELAHAAAAASLRATNTVGSVVSVDECLSFARQFD